MNLGSMNHPLSRRPAGPSFTLTRAEFRAEFRLTTLVTLPTIPCSPSEHSSDSAPLPGNGASVIERHGVSATPPPHGDHAREILEQVASGKRVSQRSLARDTGIALGLANLLIRRMVRQGWVRMIRVRRNRIRYLITPAGVAEKARRSRAHFAGSVRYYAQARDRIAQRFVTLSDEWPSGNNGSAEKRIVFCGAGEEAEIGYVCLQGTDLQLVGVIDDQPGKQFFGLPVRPYESLRAGRLADVPFDIIVVMSFADERPIRRRLAAVNCSASVFWI